MPINIGKEMALPMEQIIGGPLQAVIKAQSLAASETARFIQDVGLNPAPSDGGNASARMVNFSFERRKPVEAGEDGATSDSVTNEVVSLTVPLLTIVPVPFIRVERKTLLDFFAAEVGKLNQQKQRDQQKKLKEVRDAEKAVKARSAAVQAQRKQLSQLKAKARSPFLGATLRPQIAKQEIKVKVSEASLKTATRQLQLQQQQLAAIGRRAATDYPALWSAFELSYAGLKAVYDDMSAAYREGRALPRLERVQPASQALTNLVSRSALAKPVKDKDAAMIRDFAETLVEMGRITKQLNDLQGEGIRVRVDPSALAEAPEAARQRIKLTFRAESQETVKVQGKDMEIAK